MSCQSNIFLEHILQVALSLYVQDQKLPLPSQDEVLICNQYTTEEEVSNYLYVTPSLSEHIIRCDQLES